MDTEKHAAWLAGEMVHWGYHPKLIDDAVAPYTGPFNAARTGQHMLGGVFVVASDTVHPNFAAGVQKAKVCFLVSGISDGA